MQFCFKLLRSLLEVMLHRFYQVSVMNLTVLRRYLHILGCERSKKLWRAFEKVTGTGGDHPYVFGTNRFPGCNIPTRHPHVFFFLLYFEFQAY